MAGFKIKLIDDTYIGFDDDDRVVKTDFKNAHLYSSVASTVSIIKFMFKCKDIKKQDKPIIVNNSNEIVKFDTLD